MQRARGRFIAVIFLRFLFFSTLALLLLLLILSVIRMKSPTHYFSRARVCNACFVRTRKLKISNGQWRPAKSVNWLYRRAIQLRMTYTTVEMYIFPDEIMFSTPGHRAHGGCDGGNSLYVQQHVYVQNRRSVKNAHRMCCGSFVFNSR